MAPGQLPGTVRLLIPAAAPLRNDDASRAGDHRGDRRRPRQKTLPGQLHGTIPGRIEVHHKIVKDAAGAGQTESAC